MWDRKGNVRCVAARVAGAIVGVAGLAFAGIGGAAANRWGLAGLLIVAVSALLAGAGLAALIASWELRVRTPEGTRLWLRVESFRRFLAEAPAPRGPEPDYTAWAIALGESDRWSQIIAPSGAPPVSTGSYRYARMTRQLSDGALTAITESSSSGGGGGGGVGGDRGGAAVEGAAEDPGEAAGRR